MSKNIAVKSILYTEKANDEILVFEDYDTVKEQYYYRPIGGTVEFGEKSTETLVREVMEETGQHIKIDSLLLVTENLFELNGIAHHEIVFIYSGHFVSPQFLTQQEFMITESSGEQILCKWINKNEFKSGKLFLVPEPLVSVL